MNQGLNHWPCDLWITALLYFTKPQLVTTEICLKSKEITIFSNSSAVCNCLKSWSQRPHQMLCLFPSDANPPSRRIFHLFHLFRIVVLLNDGMSSEFWCIGLNQPTHCSCISLNVFSMIKSWKWCTSNSMNICFTAKVKNFFLPHFIFCCHCILEVYSPFLFLWTATWPFCLRGVDIVFFIHCSSQKYTTKGTKMCIDVLT